MVISYDIDMVSVLLWGLLIEKPSHLKPSLQTHYRQRQDYDRQDYDRPVKNLI
jgi:hypothetical protein